MIVYDIEIEKCIPDRRAQPDPSLRYCAGWNDHANMGIAVLCAFDTRDEMPHVYCADNLGAFRELIDGQLVAGFNNRGFDDKLLAANGITVGRSWDLCYAMRKACGEPETFTPGVTKGGRRLDDICRANLPVTKSMHGELAPVEWQRGRIGGVIDYCMRDVMLTLTLIRKLPTLIDPVTGSTVQVEGPQD